MKKIIKEKKNISEGISALTTLSKVSEVLHSAFDFNKLLNEIIILAVKEMNAEAGSVMLVESGKLVVRASFGENGFNKLGAAKNIGEGVSGWVAKMRKGLLIKDISKDPGFKHHFNPRYRTPDCVSAPIMINDRILGVININYKKSGKLFSNADLKLLMVLAAAVAIVINNFKLIEDVRQKERAYTIGELTSKMAHEIRNPLNGIKMNVQLLYKKMNNPDMEEHYTVILNEIKRLDNLLKTMLDFSKIWTLNSKSIYIPDILNKVISMIILNEPKIIIKKQYAENLPLIMGDEEKLEQAFLNLCLNAAQSMNGAGTLSISAEFISIPELHTSEIHLSISDTGPGISSEDKAKIFTPFFTTREDGTGVGLSITEHIIKLHQGSISFVSTPGKGTTFYIILPVKEIK